LRVLQVLCFARRSATPHVVARRSLIRPQTIGAIGGGRVATTGTAFCHAWVEPRGMPPHLCSLIWGGIIPVPWNRAGDPLSLGLGLALVPAVAVGGFGVLPITTRLVCLVRVDSPVGGAVIRGGTMSSQRRWLVAAGVSLVVLVTKRVGKVVSLRGAVNCVLLSLVEGGGRGARGAERER
jgi:hypothetical protein